MVPLKRNHLFLVNGVHCHEECPRGTFDVGLIVVQGGAFRAIDCIASLV